MWEEFLFHKDLGGQDIDTVPSYYLNLLLSIITVNVKTVEIIKGLPKVKF
jgi:hypothetical protein